MTTDPKRIVILGGGFAGVYTARQLEKLLRTGEASTTLINRENYWVYQPMLPEVIPGSIGLTNVVSPIRRLCPCTNLIMREVEDIDLTKQIVTMSPGFYPRALELKYDYLVIALGNITDLRGMLGLIENAMPFRTLADTIVVRNHLIHVLEEADVEDNPELRCRLLTFVVGGGGFSKGKTDTGRLWTYVRDDRPFGGQGPPAAMFYYSRDRHGEHPQAHLADYAGILQADAFSGYNKLYEVDRKPGPIAAAGCWAHARRPFFALADIAANARRKAQDKTTVVISPLALEAVRRIDALFDIERSINGQSAERRRAVRQESSAPLVADLEVWLREQRAKLSRGNDLAKAMDYLLKRWPAFTRFLEDGRICLSNNAAERAMRSVALGRRSWLFAGSDRGGQRAGAIYSLIATAK